MSQSLSVPTSGADAQRPPTEHPTSSATRPDQGPEVLIVSATRHEGDNVAPLTKRLDDSLSDLGITWELLFVDDSDDETPDRIRDLVDQGYPVRMFHRAAPDRDGGLSGALNVAFLTASSPWLLVIDGDLQHPPEVVPSMLEPLITGAADVVIASRYVPGGSATGLAGSLRPAVSRAATRLVQLLFPRLRPIKDPVSGFFALDASVIEGTDLRPEGYKMLVEVLVRGRWDRALEVPFHFAGRTNGVSNVSFGQGMAFLVHMARLWKDTTGPRLLRRIGASNPPHRLGPLETETGDVVHPSTFA